MTLFGLVRHGQTEYNRQGLFQGSSDVPLNDTGRDQAHVALDTVPPVDWDLAMSSSLSRAEETARIIAEDHDIPFAGTEPRLVEIDWGAAEGNPVAEMEERYPGRTFPGRETTQSVVDRAAAALEDLAEQHPGKNVLVVAHGTLIRLLLSGVTGEHLRGRGRDLEGAHGRRRGGRVPGRHRAARPLPPLRPRGPPPAPAGPRARPRLTRARPASGSTRTYRSVDITPEETP